MARVNTATRFVEITQKAIERPQNIQKKPNGHHSLREVNGEYLILIDSRHLTRDSLLQLFGAAMSELSVLALANPEELHEQGADILKRAAMLVMNIGAGQVSDSSVCDAIAGLKTALGDTPIILIGDRTDSSQVARALLLGVRAYIPTSLSCPVVVEAMRLVRAGGTFIPASALLDAIGHTQSCVTNQTAPVQSDAEQGSPTGEVGAALTPRQLEVLDLLRKGASNKIIAYSLKMQESTVKVHIRQIMRKFNVTNRTQVAIFAFRTVNADMAARKVVQ